MRQEFSLVPWHSPQGSESIPDVQISGWIDRTGDLLEIHYQLVGDLEAVAFTECLRSSIAAPAKTPTRRFGLWEATCLEFFLAPAGQTHYWEFNLSPSGDWNVFRLEDYREGLGEEALFTALPFQVNHQEQQLSLSLALSLESLVERATDLEVAITAVLQDRAGVCSYWALSHPGPEADFHRRDGFTVRLLGSAKEKE